MHDNNNNQQPPVDDSAGEAAAAANNNSNALRFEDLTIDDDLPLLDRVVRYCRSGIALQRLVHVKMLAETSETVGTTSALQTLVPLLQPLVTDPESIIRQHLATQLLPLSIVCMYNGFNGHGQKIKSVEDVLNDHNLTSTTSSNSSASTTVFGSFTGSASNKRIRQRKILSYNANGYKIVTSTIISQYLSVLLADSDVDVRRSASEALAGLALHIKPEDVASSILPIPMKMASSNKTSYKDKAKNANNTVAMQSNSNNQNTEELRITASNLLAELAGSSESGLIPRNIVTRYIMPTILLLCDDKSFRVRRSAAQALPRVLGGVASIEDAQNQIIPAFTRLSRDDMYRVRKSTGECLVDMSRSLMLLAARVASSDNDESDNVADDSSGVEEMRAIQELRRSSLIPIAVHHLNDSNKFVRHGMMQFLGPFIASFYPLISTVDNQSGTTALHMILPGSNGGFDAMTTTTSTSVAKKQQPIDNSASIGIGAQFFPHASSMVSRLNSSTSTTGKTPTPTPETLNNNNNNSSRSSHSDNRNVNKVGSDDDVSDEFEQLMCELPYFLHANRLSISSLRTVVAHRRINPPDDKDLGSIMQYLLDPFCSLSKVKTGDENTDAEMRVYCAYSFPAVVLLLGSENWDGQLKDCFLKLINPSYNPNDSSRQEASGNNNSTTPPPLPVKRCLASSLHTVAHILGPDLAVSDILPVFREHFFRDTDDSVRLNVIRNFSWLLSLLPSSTTRNEYLLLWSDNVKGEDILSAYKRSATNPMLLNWRQRDYVSRSMPDMLGLVDLYQVKDVLWPVIKMLLSDSISLVREDAKWCIPLLFKVYCPENVVQGGRRGISDDKILTDSREIKKRKALCAEMCKDIVLWIKETILGNSSNTGATQRASVIRRDSSNGSKGNFSQRQLYCNICLAVGLSLRFADIAFIESFEHEDEDLPGIIAGGENNENYDDLLALYKQQKDMSGPYQALTNAERKHLRRVLVFDLLPPALEMKDDRVTNVRLTLMKVLQIMPDDVKTLPNVVEVLKELEDEVETWESFNNVGGGDNNAINMMTSSGGVTSGTTSTKTTKSSAVGNSNAARSSTTDEDYPMDEGGGSAYRGTTRNKKDTTATI